MKHLHNLDSVWKSKNPEKIVHSLSKVVNVMKDLIRLAERHQIEAKLYNSDALEYIYKSMGDGRVTRWLSSVCDDRISDEEIWVKLMKFLEKEIRINQQKGVMMMKVSPALNKERTTFVAEGTYEQPTIYDRKDQDTLVCSICGESDNHVATKGPGDMMVVQYFACKKFVDMTPTQRFTELKKKGLCIQCLYPGAKYRSSKHKEGRCYGEFTCKHPSHDKYPTKMHVLVCNEHKDLPENRDLLELYRDKFILKQSNLSSFSNQLQLSYHSQCYQNDHLQTESAIYMLQTIEINQENYTIFFDSGCNDFVATSDAIRRLKQRAKLEYDGPTTLGGVGGVQTQSNGIYSVKLPLVNGKDAIMTGPCLDRITDEFPLYPLKQVENDIQESFRKSGKELKNLPKLPKEVGGKVDFMVGIKYLRYFPRIVHQLLSGLTIYKSHFRNYDGSRGVIGGPHQIFTEIEKRGRLCQHTTVNFVSNQQLMLNNTFHLQQNIDILDFKYDDQCFDITLDDDENVQSTIMLSRPTKMFEKFENAGTCISYRCINCRDCQDCKSHEKDLMSIREEIEQQQIEKSVTVDVEKRLTIARLPFLQDPTIKLHPNRHKALKVLDQQVKKLNKNSQDRDDVVKSEKKLQDLGHVEYIKIYHQNYRRC